MSGRSSTERDDARHRLRLAVVVPGVLFVDMLTKRWAERDLTDSGPVSLVGHLVRLRLAHHTGPAFEVFADSGRWPNVVAGLTLSGVALGVFDPRSAFNSPRGGWLVALMVAGGVANLVNRLPDGRVTDFLDVGIGPARWPTGNVADACIALGFAGLLVAQFGDVLRRVEFTHRATDDQHGQTWEGWR